MLGQALRRDQLLTAKRTVRGAVLGVSVSFGQVRALDDVTVALEPGLTGLLGVNGAGKTTLMRVIAGAVTPDAGRVVIDADGPETEIAKKELPRLVGYLPQSVLPVRGLTAQQYVEYFAYLKGMGRRSARAASAASLERVGLAGEARKATRALSGGMLRRVGLAAALVGDPALVLLDEPMAGLDPEQRQRMRALIADVAQDTSVLLSTHLSEDVSELAARVCVLDRGTVRFAGALGLFVHSGRPTGASVEQAFLTLVGSGAAA